MSMAILLANDTALAAARAGFCKDGKFSMGGLHARFSACSPPGNGYIPGHRKAFEGRAETCGGVGAVFAFQKSGGGADTARGTDERSDANEIILVDQPSAPIIAAFRRDLPGYDVTMELRIAYVAAILNVEQAQGIGGSDVGHLETFSPS